MVIFDASRRVVSGLIAWIGVPLLHGVWMMIDWKLRDPHNPMAGGIPDAITTIFQWSSLVLFGVLVFASLGRIRSLTGRGLTAILCTGVALAAMSIGWLFYVIGKGIDTL